MHNADTMAVISDVHSSVYTLEAVLKEGLNEDICSRCSGRDWTAIAT
jgi:hypothetical protein